jgi:hypothetical protein
VPDKASPTPCADIDPWARAYEIVQQREPELMTDYKRHIASLQDDAAPGDVLTPRTVESVVNKLFEAREKMQWRISFLGNDIRIREQVERLAKFLLWSDPVVKNALSAQPYAALAWSGVSILLPVSKWHPLMTSLATAPLLIPTAPYEQYHPERDYAERLQLDQRSPSVLANL